MYALSPSCNQDSLWYMLYQLDYEATVCLVSFVQSKQSLVNVLSTELWIKCLPYFLPPISKVSSECYINLTMKQMSDLSPSSNQQCLKWMLYQLNYKSNVWLRSPSSNQDSLWWMLYQLNYEANVCLVSGLRLIKIVSGQRYITWTMKQMSALSPAFVSSR